MKYLEAFQAWINGEKNAGYDKRRKDAIRDGSLLVTRSFIVSNLNLSEPDDFIVRLQLDREPYAEPEPFAK